MSQTYNGLEIALVGTACRYPGANDPESFWANLSTGVESIRIFTPAELLAAGVEPGLIRHPDYVPAKGVLDGLDQFDADFFGYTSEQAALMDPQVRLLHECAWEALTDAGCDPRRQPDPIGVYLGGETDPQWLARAGANLGAGRQFQASLYGESKYFASLLAHRLDLRGPTVTLESACSSSLVAVHLACQGLLAGDCRLALAGGVSIFLPHQAGYLYQEGLMFSRDGHCRPFAAQASGTVFSDGLGLVVLQRLEDALVANAPIYAIIKGSALNNDGARRAGFTAPGVQGQTEVVRTALEAAEVDPESLGFIEAHGTATQLGDAIEVQALTRAFNSGRRGSCRLGSVKGNLGHLFNAAGVAGLMKASLALDKRLIPPSLHCAQPHPGLELEATPFLVNSAPWPWETAPDAPPRRAGVSSFGIGGTNVHVVLEEAPASFHRAERPRPASPAFQRRRFPIPPASPTPARTVATSAASCPTNNPDATRRLLADLWWGSLGGRVGDATDDFFALGGDSITLLALTEQVAQRLGASPTIADLLERPTLAALEALVFGETMSAPLRSATDDLQAQPLMELRGDGTEALLCFPDIVGRGVVFLGLASLIQDRRVLALNYQPGTDLVSQCLAAVSDADIRGPLTFLGYSAGASISLAVTRELEARGHSVHRLIFLDAYCPSPVLLKSPDLAMALKRWIFANLAEHLAGDDHAPDLAIREAWFDRCLSLSQGKPVAADIHLITAQDRQTNELFLDWSMATTGRHQIHQGSGSHLEMLRYPFVKDNHRIMMSIMATEKNEGESWS